MQIEEFMKRHGIESPAILIERTEIWQSWVLGFWYGNWGFDRNGLRQSEQVAKIVEVLGVSIEELLDSWYETRWSGWVYIFQQENRYKIGRSWDPDRRYRALARKYKGLINLHAMWSNNIRYLEHCLHKRFDEYKLGKEWFLAPQKDINALQLVSICEYKNPAHVDPRFK